MNNQPMHALASVITEKFIAASPKEAAMALAGLATHEVLLLIGSLKAQSIVAVLNFMDPPKAAAVLRRLPLKQASYVLTRLEVAQAARLWKEFSAPYQERLTSVLEPAFVNVLKTASAYAAVRENCAEVYDEDGAFILTAYNHPSLSSDYCRHVIGEAPEMPEEIKESLKPVTLGRPVISSADDIRKIVESL